MTNLDRSMYESINRLADHTQWAHGLMRVWAKYGISTFAVLLLVGWWTACRVADPVVAVSKALWAGGGAVVALGVNQPIGSLINRARPYAVIPGAHVLVDRTKDFSFPSDHAVTVGAVAVGLLLLERRLGLVASFAAVFMAFARVYVGAHFPGDVLAGLLLGGAVAAVLAIPAGLGLRRFCRGLANSPLRFFVEAGPRNTAEAGVVTESPD